MSLLTKIACIVFADRLRSIERMRTDAALMQQKVLHSLLTTAQKTQFAQSHGLSADSTYEDFRQRVPVSDYEHFAPYVEQMVRGEANVTWPGQIRWFAKSSGTTDAKSKFIPVTTESLHTAQYRGSLDALVTYAKQHPESAIYKGKCLTLGGSKQISTINNRAQTGDLSAIMIGNAPTWSNFFKTPQKDVALLANWEEKLPQIMKATVGENVSYLAGVPSWMLVLLHYILEHTGKSNIQEVWPNLELFIHGGINFEPYRSQYEQIAPRGLNFIETYNASEGFFALQTDPDDRSMQLMMDYGIFYEFVPLDEVGQEFPAGATPIEGVSTGVDYALVITANNGLWRYMIGDTVRFTDTRPHKIRISGRTKLYINAFGEELMIGNAEVAIRQACEQTGAVVREYTAAPIFMDKNSHGRHEWLIEFERQPTDVNLFSSILDGALQEVNSDYEAKRHNNTTLAPLKLTIARDGLFYDYMRQNGRLGGQNKVPRLKNDRSLIDQLLALN